MHTPRSPAPLGSLPSIDAAAKRRALNVPIRLMPMTLSTGCSWCGPRLPATFSAQPTPAQHTLMRSPPSASAAAATAASTSSALVTSVLRKLVSAPSSSARAAPFSSLRSAISTRAPCSCRRRVVASPSPEAPPNTMALDPSTCMRRGRLSRRAGQGDREQLLGIRVPAAQLQSRGRVVALQALTRELGADLGPQLLAGGELELEVQVGDVDGHRPTGAQAHLDPLAAAVEEGDVLERRGLEVRGQLAVHHVQDVAVELRGHTRCVVVGGLDHLRLLDQVGAEQEVIGGPQERPHVAQARTAAAGWEAPDRAAQQADEARPPVGRARYAVEVALEVADDTMDLEPVVLVHQ